MLTHSVLAILDWAQSRNKFLLVIQVLQKVDLQQEHQCAAAPGYKLQALDFGQMM